MLRDKRFDGGWQKLATMSRVVGADEEATKRLLLGDLGGLYSLFDGTQAVVNAP